MRNWIGIALSVATALVGTGTSAMAAIGNEDAVVALHIAPASQKTVCDYAMPACNQVTTSAPLGNYNVYLFVANHSDSLGTTGISLGIDYDGTPGSGVDVYSWTLCSDLDFPNDGWPEPNQGNVVLWLHDTNCQYGPAPVAGGVFSVTAYSPDCFSVIPRPVDNAVYVVDCLLAQIDISKSSPSHLGYVCFGAGEGYNPCSVIVAVQPTTWGNIKTLYQ